MSIKVYKFCVCEMGLEERNRVYIEGEGMNNINNKYIIKLMCMD